MNKRILIGGLVVALVSMAGCMVESSQDVATSDGSAANWEHPMTPWGDPDLQGVWPITHLVSTPLQRNPEYGDREYLTDEEYAETQASLDQREERYRNEIANNKMGMGHWAEATTRSDAARLTSLISYPPDGRFPALTERGEALRPQFGSSSSTEQSGRGFDSLDDFNAWDRCITRGMPRAMLPNQYNNGIRIIQAPGYVVIDHEMIHESRIVPLDGRPTLDPAIRQWTGFPRGHWEGSTLVVETTNYNGKVGMPNATRSALGETPSTTAMKTTERFTRISDTVLNYEMTIEDPEVLTSHWTVRYPMFLDPEYRFFEYACHEDNTVVRNFIETSRYERAQVAAGQ